MQVALLTFRSASKHVLFALGVDPTARDAGFQPLQCHARLLSIHVTSLHKSGIANLTRRQANAVGVATKVCFSLFDGSEVLVSATKGKRAMCGASETCGLFTVQI